MKLPSHFASLVKSPNRCFLHRYIFKNHKKAGLQELGPRFTLKLRSLQRGTFDSKYGEYEWIHKVCLILVINLLANSSFIRLFLRSPGCSVVRSFARSLVHSFVRSFVCWFVRTFVCSFVPSLIRLFVRTLVRSLVHSFVRSLVHFVCLLVRLFIIIIMHSPSSSQAGHTIMFIRRQQPRFQGLSSSRPRKRERGDPGNEVAASIAIQL